jgi:predicted ATPase
MPANILNRISIEGYKSIRELDIELRPLNVLVGANGAGKSNFIGVFEFLRYIVDQELQSYVVRSGGADAFLHFGKKVTSEIAIYLIYNNYTYGITLTSSNKDRLVINGENVTFPERLNILGFTSEVVRTESTLKEQISSTGLFKDVLDVMQSWKIFHFHDTSSNARIKSYTKIYDNVDLKWDGGNLAAILLKLKEHNPHYYNNIIKLVRLVAPFFRDFVLEPTGDNLLLRWSERGSDNVFGADVFSDGTLRFICLATLLFQPELPSLILLDEPELGLHPYAIVLLAGMLKSASTKTQIIISTQSVTLINQFEPEDIIIVDRERGERGQSTFKRLDGKNIANWLEEYSIGELWEKNVIGGRPR